MNLRFSYCRHGQFPPILMSKVTQCTFYDPSALFTPNDLPIMYAPHSNGLASESILDDYTNKAQTRVHEEYSANIDVTEGETEDREEAQVTHSQLQRTSARASDLGSDAPYPRFEQTTFLCLSRQVCSVFHLETAQLTQSILEKPLPSCIRNWAFLPIFELRGTLLTGGNAGDCSACWCLDHETGCFKPLSNMIASRVFPGMVYFKGKAYAFGGEPVPGLLPLDSAESLDIQGPLLVSAWTAEPNHMVQSRSHFNPCVYQDLIYLAAGGHPSLEVFSASDHSFGPLKVRLLDKGPCIMAAYKYGVVVVTKSFVYRVNLRTQKVEVVRHKVCSVHANSPSLLYKGCVYAARNGDPFSVDIYSGVVRTEEEFSH